MSQRENTMDNFVGPLLANNATYSVVNDWYNRTHSNNTRLFDDMQGKGDIYVIAHASLVQAVARQFMRVTTRTSTLGLTSLEEVE